MCGTGSHGDPTSCTLGSCPYCSIPQPWWAISARFSVVWAQEGQAEFRHMSGGSSMVPFPKQGLPSHSTHTQLLPTGFYSPGLRARSWFWKVDAAGAGRVLWELSSPPTSSAKNRKRTQNVNVLRNWSPELSNHKYRNHKPRKNKKKPSFKFFFLFQ